MHKENDGEDPFEINSDEILNPDDVTEYLDEKTALAQGKVKLSVCTVTIIAVGSRCDRYQIGDVIMVPCTAQVSCPINGNRKLILSNGCWLKATRLKDCHWVWI